MLRSQHSDMSMSRPVDGVEPRGQRYGLIFDVHQHADAISLVKAARDLRDVGGRISIAEIRLEVRLPALREHLAVALLVEAIDHDAVVAGQLLENVALSSHSIRSELCGYDRLQRLVRRIRDVDRRLVRSNSMTRPPSAGRCSSTSYSRPGRRSVQRTATGIVRSDVLQHRLICAEILPPRSSSRRPTISQGCPGIRRRSRSPGQRQGRAHAPRSARHAAVSSPQAESVRARNWRDPPVQRLEPTAYERPPRHSPALWFYFPRRRLFRAIHPGRND